MLQPPNTADMSPYRPPLDPIAPLRVALRAHYEIEREIGQGAYATVYLARDLKHERRVALKVLNADPTSETPELRFIREIRMLARLQHPNILPLHDSGHVEALLYYVMPFVHGETLRERIDRERQLAIEDAVCIAQEVADALAYAHGEGIIHRDIKPENILLSGGHAVVADFGIARIINVAGIRQLTRTGLGSPGTPQYMAPEQLLGEREIDARADIYSVGCVLYEMLTGKPPFAGKDGFVKRFTEAPPSPSSVRTAIPDWLETIVSIALERDPDDRYATAGQLARALTLGLARERTTPAGSPAVRVTPVDDGQSEIPGRRRGASPGAAARTKVESAGATEDSSNRHFARIRRWTRSRRGRVVAVGIAGLALAAFGAIARPNVLKAAFGRLPSPDSSRYVILPIISNSTAFDGMASKAADKLYDAFRAWEGLNLVPDLKVEETIQESGRSPRTLNDALSFARRFGAGQLVWGRVVRVGDSVRPRVELYDLRRPNSSVKELVLKDDRPETYAAVATTLLALPDRPAVAIGGDGQTHNYAAWDAYNRGHIALANWDLAQARAEFARAVNADPQFPVARLWLGQVEEWRNPQAPEGWRENVERAATAGNTMTERDRLLSVALTALASKQYPAACNAYRDLTRLDSLDFIGWYGLGECQGLDPVVLADRSSPSEWRWRSSYDAAVKSFNRALRLNPGAHALLSFQRLRRLLPTTAVNPRVDDPVTPKFAAFPSLSPSDTLEFVPYPISTFRKGLPPSATLTLNQALSRNLDVLVDVVNDWVRVSPGSPDAYESLADVLETRGDITDGTNPAVSAPAAVRKAFSLSSNSQQRLRLAVRDGRLRFKRDDYVGAQKAADSLLTHGASVDINDPPVLISLTALTGRIKATSEQAKAVVIPQKLEGIALSSSLRAAAAELFANAALGICGDTLRALRDRLEQEIQSSIAEGQRVRVRASLLSRPLSMMVPCTSGASALDIPSPTGALANLQQAFARRNVREVNRNFKAIAQARRAYRPGDVSLDRTYQEAWIQVAMGDTAGAITQLDRSLNAIPSMSAGALREPGAAAAAGRAMALRADLAQTQGDLRTARRWGLAAAELWADADLPLQPTVSRMKALAAQSR